MSEKTFRLSGGSKVTTNIEGFDPRPSAIVAAAAQALGATPTDVAGRWNLAGHPELTDGQLVHIYLERRP